MELERKNVLKISAVYTGTVLGAGFASGKELVNFFVDYGGFGFLGLVISGIFFSLTGFGVLKIVFENKITNYREFSEFIFGKKIGAVSEWIVCGFLLILFSAMIAAGGEMGNLVFGIGKTESEVILSCLCFLTFLFELDGFVEINILLCPILVLGGIAVGVYIFLFSPETVFFNDFLPFFGCYDFSLFENFISSSIIYVSYNIITAITVLISLNKLVLSKKIAKFGGIFGGACVCLLGVSMSLPLFSDYENIRFDEMPILSIVLDYDALKYLYVVILLSAIFTTALANGFSLIQNFDEKGKKRLFVKIFIAFWGICVAKVGFSNFIEKIYPIFGIIGLIEIIFIFKAAFFSKKE